MKRLMKIALLVILQTIYITNNTNADVIEKERSGLLKDITESYYHNPDDSDCPVESNEDLRMGPYEVLAQLVQAEAGNQDLMGKRLVADVVLNRIESDIFPDSLEDVIFQPGQFAVVTNGAFDKAGWYIEPETYKAVEIEVKMRSNSDILYFSRGKSAFASTHFKHGDHWFSY